MGYAGDTNNIYSTLTMPSVPAGAYNILFFIDNYGFVNNEITESNNVKYFQVNVIVPAGPDLSIVAQSISATSLTVYDTFDAHTITINSGDQPVPYCLIGYYLSTDATWSASDILLGNDQTGPLASNGDTVNITTNLTIPYVNAGAYYVLFYIDYNHVVSESNETNNVKNIPINITNNQMGLHSTTNVSGLALYPNPASELINVELESEIIGNHKVEILNSSGMKVYENITYKPAEKLILKINIENLASGLYTVKVSNSKNISFKKFIIK